MHPLFLCAFILSWPLANVLALEPPEADLVPIGTVLADLQQYNLQTVRFQRTITKMTKGELRGLTPFPLSARRTFTGRPYR